MAIVGYMGSGKSTVGQILADKLGWEFLDLDQEITAQANSSIAEIFSEHGEDHFRALESHALQDALGGPNNRVIACGGGAVVCSENRALLKNAATVFLHEEAETLYQRTRGDDRPLRGVDLEEFKRRYAERMPYYTEVSNLKVEVDGRAAEEVVEEIERWLNE